MELAVQNLDLEAVKQCSVSPATEEDREYNLSIIEKTVRKLVMKMAGENVPVAKFEPFFLFVVQLANADLCNKVLTVGIITDMLESASKSMCAELFSIVENHIDVWKSPAYFDVCKNSVLRMCNDLLKRLSRTIDTQFCGRINILLSRSLPLNERSGLNLTSQFNSTNDTEFDREELAPEVLKEGRHEDESAVGNDIETTRDIPIDFDLYQRFWELQKYFSDPNSVYLKAEFELFQKNLNEVLIMFTTYKLDKRRGAANRPQTQDAMDVDDFRRPDVFFAKYQTSQKLLHLQFADPQFRRFFFVQCLILTNYLQSDVKFRDSLLVLSDEQSKYIAEVNEKCYKLLKETFPRGWHFSEFVKKIISREKIWSIWKNEGCPDWLSNSVQNKRPPVKSFKRAPPVLFVVDGKADLGSDNLNKLWNVDNHAGDNLAAARDLRRNFVPKASDVLNDALDHADPEQGVEPEYSCFRDEKWQWRATRLFLSSSDYFLNGPSTPAGKKPCPAYHELLQKAMFRIAQNSVDQSTQIRGTEIEARALEHAIKLAESEKLAEEAARQRAEEEAKTRALEAAAERRKKDEELAAQRAKELAEIKNRKTKVSSISKGETAKNVEDGEVMEDSPPTKATTNGIDSLSPGKAISNRRKSGAGKAENGHATTSLTTNDTDAHESSSKKRSSPATNGSSSPTPAKRSRKSGTNRNDDDKRSDRNGGGKRETNSKEKSLPNIPKRSRNDINFPSNIPVSDTVISDIGNALADRSREVCSVLEYSDHKDDRHRTSAGLVKAALRQWVNRESNNPNLRNLGSLLNDVQCVDDTVMNVFRKEVDAHSSNSTTSRGSSRSRYHRKDR